MDLSDVLRRLKIAGFIFVGILCAGVVGYGYISNWRWLDAFYMTAITIATIGFHEVIDLSSSSFGKIFTVFLAFSGIGVLTYFFSNLAALFIEGDLRNGFKKRKMLKKIAKMEGHYIICGCGRVGRNIAQELHATNREFILTDRSEEVMEHFLPDIPGAIAISGDSTDDAFLESLRVDRARGIFASASDDNTNLVICITARQLNPNVRIITRVNDIAHTRKMKRAGADRIISPNYIGGLRMASEMVRPSVTSFLDDMIRTSQHNLRLEEIVVTTKFDGKNMADLPLHSFDHTLILALKKKESWIYKPKADQVVEAGNEIIVMTTAKERKSIEEQMI